ncbi:MAG: hypothetical protein KC620_25515, partial [Myxococcales bacterium]|nr:hypothetical protein [Myxococcales bacterium]
MDAFGRLALVGIFLPACATPADDGACRTERDCDADWLCRDGRCRPATHCMADGDCASPDICHESRCRPRGCTDDADCGPARFCRAGLCAPLPDNACATDTDCPSGACEPTTRFCRPVVCNAGCAPAGCTVDADCPSTEWCAPEGRCQPGCRLVREACP